VQQQHHQQPLMQQHQDDLFAWSVLMPQRAMMSVSSTLAKPGHRSLLGDQSSTNLPPTARSSIIIMNAIASTSSKHHNGQQRQRATNQW
jgi:hypothetical protein